MQQVDAALMRRAVSNKAALDDFRRTGLGGKPPLELRCLRVGRRAWGAELLGDRKQRPARRVVCGAGSADNSFQNVAVALWIDRNAVIEISNTESARLCVEGERDLAGRQRFAVR